MKTIENLERIGLEYNGAYKSLEDKQGCAYSIKNALKICFISYTKGMNGIKIPDNKPYLVNSLKKTSALRLIKRIKKNKKRKFSGRYCC
ncbi:hypothetical protein [Halalkalibacterium halodurans]|uniref:hypothetical protein n=1 Tax=Halalkalibacterium halodurans TaxID=86665 RepID=UPI00399D5456